MQKNTSLQRKEAYLSLGEFRKDYCSVKAI